MARRDLGFAGGLITAVVAVGATMQSAQAASFTPTGPDNYIQPIERWSLYCNLLETGINYDLLVGDILSSQANGRYAQGTFDDVAFKILEGTTVFNRDFDTSFGITQQQQFSIPGGRQVAFSGHNQPLELLVVDATPGAEFSPKIADRPGTLGLDETWRLNGEIIEIRTANIALGLGFLIKPGDTLTANSPYALGSFSSDVTLTQQSADETIVSVGRDTPYFAEPGEFGIAAVPENKSFFGHSDSLVLEVSAADTSGSARLQEIFENVGPRGDNADHFSIGLTDEVAKVTFGSGSVRGLVAPVSITADPVDFMGYIETNPPRAETVIVSEILPRVFTPSERNTFFVNPQRGSILFTLGDASFTAITDGVLQTVDDKTSPVFRSSTVLTKPGAVFENVRGAEFHGISTAIVEANVDWTTVTAKGETFTLDAGESRAFSFSGDTGIGNEDPFRASQPVGVSIITTGLQSENPQPPPASVPEPASVLGLLTLGVGVLANWSGSRIILLRPRSLRTERVS